MASERLVELESRFETKTRVGPCANARVSCDAEAVGHKVWPARLSEVNPVFWSRIIFLYSPILTCTVDVVSTVFSRNFGVKHDSECGQMQAD